VSLLWSGRGERQGIAKTRKRRDHFERDKEEGMKVKF
jgi:hypothetical protein